jgi:hypothetical protein
MHSMIGLASNDQERQIDRLRIDEGCRVYKSRQGLIKRRASPDLDSQH